MKTKEKLNILATKLTIKYYIIAAMLWIGSAFTWAMPLVAIGLWVLGFAFYSYAFGYSKAVRSMGSLIDSLEGKHGQED